MIVKKKKKKEVTIDYRDDVRVLRLSFGTNL